MAPWNGLRAASLFCGVGGSSLGYRMAGFRVVYALDWDRTALHWYERNHGLRPDEGDVRELEGSTIADRVRSDGGEELDVLDGSPPCQPFSTAGYVSAGGRPRGASDTEVNMFPDFVRLVGEVRPRAFVAENVAGLANARNRRYLREVEAELRSHGYDVETRLLRAELLGVPQARRRVAVIGLRRDLGIRPAQAFPAYQPKATSIRDALPYVARVAQAERPVGTEAQERFRRPKTFAATAPLPTVTTGGIGSVCSTHLLVEEARSGQRRPIEIDELKALCSFPPDFELPEARAAAWKLLGNAVPPKLAYSWAARLSELLGR
jgi:DNA (cytosine-5)-methyltransferase 1